MDRQKIYIDKGADRESLCTILVRNGYTVRIGSEKVNNKTKYFVEYFKGI